MKDREILKCVEELNELSTILIQQYNKPKKNFEKEIIEEIGDVYVWLNKLRNHYGKGYIKERIEYKKEKHNLK